MIFKYFLTQIYLQEPFQYQLFSFKGKQNVSVCEADYLQLVLRVLILDIYQEFKNIFLFYPKQMNMRQLQDGTDGESSGDSQGGLQFHGTPLIAAWLPIVTLAVLVASLRWHKYSFYAHVFLALIVIGLTLGATINVLVDYGLDYQTDGSTLQTMHNTAGLIVTIWLGLQIITGVLARVIQYSPKVGTNFCIWTKRTHMISSYLIMILAKFNYLNIQFLDGQVSGGFFVLLAIDIIILIIYLLIKFKYWNISEEIIDNQLVDKQRQQRQNKLYECIQSAKESASNLLQEFKQSLFEPYPRIDVPVHYKSESQIKVQDYVIFNDFVYATDSFKQKHPGGEHIMRLMNKRQVDRFMYGSYGPELEPYVKPHTHTQDSMRLCGMPIGKIDRVSPMKGLKTFNKCQVVLCQRVVDGSDTFLIHLRPESTPLRYDGFQLQKQIGMYYSATITNQKGRNRCTRLFTTIFCMRPDNIEFMERNFSMKCIKSQQFINELEMDYLNQNTSNLVKEECIPFIIKRYQKGELSSRLCVEDLKGEIILSEPMGAGMKYDRIPTTGNVIFVSGGTGVLPFCDFIDLLFKRVLVLESSNLSSMITRKDPLVGQDLIKDRSFVFYCAIQNILDLPVLTLYQLNHLCQSQKVRFTSVMRIKKGEDIIKSQYPNIKLQKGYFNENVVTHIKQGNISQVYICGSPEMNASMGKTMMNNEVKADLYHFM